MSVDMFLDDADSQVTAIRNMCRAHVQGLNSLKTAISQFIFEPVLIGKTYDSAKIYFQMTYIPVITGLILAAETLETAAKKLPDRYRSDVDENSLQEAVLRRHIEQLNKLMAFADHLAAGASKNSFLKTGFTKLGEHYQGQQKDEQAKLAKLMAFDPVSATLFGEVETLLDAVEQGLKEMRSGKGFSGLTGTFSTMGLNMDWVKPINDKWTEYDRRQKGIDSKKEKELEAYDVYAIVYEDTDGNAKILWHLEKDGKGVDAPELYQYLSKAGQYLSDQQYRIWSMEDYQKHLEDGWRHGINYQNGDAYNAFIKGTLATSQYVADGYNWVQETGMYDLILMAGLSYASYKVTTGTGVPEKVSGAKAPKTDFGAENPVSGKDWNNYFKEKYGAGNVQWKPNSIEDLISSPERLYGSTKNEIKSILGEGWTESTYGSAGNGWKFTNDGDGMVFYHPGDGIHGGPYYGFSTGDTGKVKIVGEDYIDFSNDKATIIKLGGE